MTTPDPATQDPQHSSEPLETTEREAAEPAQGVTDQASAAATDFAAAESEAPETEGAPVREPIMESHEQQVTLQRSVRYGRVLVSLTVIGAIVGMLLSAAFPVVDTAQYSMGQIVGFMAVIGAAIGLAVGAILSLILGLVARRRRGAAVAIQTDVR